MDRATLESLDRDALISRAQAAGVARASVLTRPELIDELLQRDPSASRDEVRRARGFLGRARDLLARVIERGLHLPDAAERVRKAPSSPAVRTAPSALPTVTLAEIYATQGHKTRAVETLEQVLAAEPEHAAASSLLDKLRAGDLAVPEPALPPEQEDTMGSSYMEDRPVEGESAAVAEPSWMLDAQPLPERYDVDECIAVSVDPTTLYVYWEIRADTLARLSKRMPGGATTLRILVMMPTWDGPRAYHRDIEVPSHAGDWFVRELPEGAVVRAAVGWKSAEGLFVSAGHSLGVEPSRRERSPVVAEWLARWTPEASVEVGPADAEAVKMARALARIEARRVAMQAAGMDEFGRPLHGGGDGVRIGFGASERVLRAPSSPTSGTWG